MLVALVNVGPVDAIDYCFQGGNQDTVMPKADNQSGVSWGTNFHYNLSERLMRTNMIFMVTFVTVTIFTKNLES